MARNVHELQYTKDELDALLAKADNQPFVIWHDENAGVYRFFPDEEKRDIWVLAYMDDMLTPEINEYQFASPITAPAPYTINISVLNDNKPILENTTDNILEFNFETLDGNGLHISEPVDVYYTFRSPSGTKYASKSYNADPVSATYVTLNIDEYISLGKNTISIMIKGRSTGTTKTVVATYSIVRLNLSSGFNIAMPILPNTSFDVNYLVEGDGDKTVNFYIDGDLVANPTVTSLEYSVPKRQTIRGLLPGKHTLLMVAYMQMGDFEFSSKLLYYEFIVLGQEMTTTVISEEFPVGTPKYSGSTRPGLSGEQYVTKIINWAYYSSDPTMFSVTILWRLYSNGVETPIASRNADIVAAENGIPPEPLRFMPTEEGTYHLQALINDVVLEGGDYTISIIKNTSNIQEAAIESMTMKLSGLGRDNNEPQETLTSWENKGYHTTFYNQPWNNNSGWVNNALVLNDGATALIDNKPFALEIGSNTRNGCTFEIDFETFNVDDDDAELLRISDPGTNASFIITSNRAILTSHDGNTIESRFKSDERIKIAFVIYPIESGEYPHKVFVYNNGVMSGVINYDTADDFNIGRAVDTSSEDGMIYLGNADSEAGIKIYYIRTYDYYINMYEELNNYFIDSGENIAALVIDNDIYADNTRIIDVNKLEGTITTVKITGSLDEILGDGAKDNKLTCGLEITSPENSNINMHCDKAQINKAGQSTLDKPVPSFHVRLDKIEGNICYDRDGKAYPKNRWAFREGNVPEKKFRLQANYMDSSGCHNASFFRLINEVYPKVKINGQNPQDVLRMPSERYATDTYPSEMEDLHGTDPSGNDWKFPYNLNICPDSIPCIVVWRRNTDDQYKFLGQYVIMEEKKSNYANGMHSIYSGVDKKGYADPFGFKSSKSGEKLWDNLGCHQMEFLRSTSPLELFMSDSDWNTEKTNSFELIYPDDDDLTPEEITAEWQKFYNDVVHPICLTYGDQTAFNDLFYGPNPKLDRWGFAAYYCLVMRNACSDSLVRNMELVTYDGYKWTPKWWDVDMQCGLQQSGACDVPPTSTRDTELVPDVYAFSGRVVVDDTLRSSWLWDALEGSEQFMLDVKAMDAALYQAGWKYSRMTEIQDIEYVDTWSNALYNESGIVKYLTYDELNYKSLQGDRTPHRHWFLRTSYDYFDALNVCGEYVSKRFEVRTINISPPKNIYITAASTSYFGWEYTNTIVQSGIRIEKGDTDYITIDRTPGYNDPIHILGANKIAELDLSEISLNLYADIDFSSTYDEILGSQLRKIVLGTNDGVIKTRLNNGEFNIQEKADVIGGTSTLDKLEYLDVQGMYNLKSINMPAMHSMKYFYAAGSSLSAFNPADGANLSEVELPTTVRSMTMNGCNLTSNDHCCIKWYETLYDLNDIPNGVLLSTVPSTLRTISFIGMGNDIGAKELILDWVNAVYDEFGDEGLEKLVLTCKNVNWTGVDVDDLLLLAKIPTVQNLGITGYIKCSGSLDSSDIIAIKEAFGDNVFSSDPGVPLRIDADSGFVLAAPEYIIAGNRYNLTGVAFPTTSVVTVTYRLYYYDNGIPYIVTKSSKDGQNVYIYNNVTLYEDSGQIITYESLTQNADFYIGVEAIPSNGSESGIVPILIKKRLYPDSMNFNVDYPSGSRVKYDEDSNTWDICSYNISISIEAIPLPIIQEDMYGTLESDSWVGLNLLSGIIDLLQENGNTIQFQVSSLPLYKSQYKIDYILTFITGYRNSGQLNLRFKEPIIAVNSRVNSILQDALVSNHYSVDQNQTMDTELWHIKNLNTLGILDIGSLLKHLAEINSFIDLEMTTLNLSNCTEFGNIGTIVLEDNTTEVDPSIIPTSDTTLNFEFELIDLSNTQCRGIKLIQNSNVLLSISYSDYTTFVELVGQSALTEVNISIASASVLDSIHIENCNNLGGITWI